MFFINQDFIDKFSQLFIFFNNFKILTLKPLNFYNFKESTPEECLLGSKIFLFLNTNDFGILNISPILWCMFDIWEGFTANKNIISSLLCESDEFDLKSLES